MNKASRSKLKAGSKAGSKAGNSTVKDGGAELLLELAATLAGPASPGKLDKAIRSCLQYLGATELSLLVFNSTSAQIARMVSHDAKDQEVHVEENWRPAPNLLAQLAGSGQRLHHSDDAALSSFLFGDSISSFKCTLHLVFMPLHEAMYGVMVFSGEQASLRDHSPQTLCDMGQLLLAAARHCIGDIIRLRSSEHLTEVLNFSDSVYASWHGESGWQYHNVKGVVELGYQQNHIDLRSLETHNPMHPDDWREARELFEESRLKGVGYTHDYRAVNSEQETRWYHAEVTVTGRSPAGHSRELVSISRNITQLRQAAATALEAAETQKWLVATVSSIFNCSDFETINGVLKNIGNRFSASRCAVRVIDPETLLCNLVAEWHDPRLSALADLFPEMTSQTGIGWMARLLEMGAYIENDIRNGRSGRKLIEYSRAIHMQATLTQPLVYDGELTGYLAIMDDKPRQWTETEIRLAKEITDTIHITILRNRLLKELKATDERFQLAMETSTYGLWDHRVAERTIYYSPHFYEKLGYSRRNEPIPLKDMLDYIHPDDHELLNQQSVREQDEGSDEVELEMRHLKSDGSEVSMLSRGRVVQRDAQGRPLRVVGVSMDITQQKRTLAELRTAREMAEEANRGKSEFLERMSHEIRTPMNAITGMSYLALETDLDKEQQNYLQDIDGAAKSLIHIIDDVLDFSKIEAGEVAIVSERFNLKLELERLIKLMSVRATQAKNTLSYTVADDVPDFVIGDKHRLGQVLTNLLSNAVKFTNGGRITLAVRCAESDPLINSVNLLFAVSDSGIGMSEQQIATLFEPFVQAEGSTSRKYGGTGLGLSICKHLVEMMGGSIHCESSPRVGTTFNLSIIFKQSQVDEHSEVVVGAAQELKTKPVEAQAHRHRRVLLAEDNVVNQRVAKGILNKYDIDVVIASNGAEAVDLLEQSGPGDFDAVLMDIEMPIMDGLTATRAIRQQLRFRTLPVIATTAHAMTGDRERCLVAGMNDHIAKPVNPQSLLQALDRVWESDTAAQTGGNG